MLRLLLPRHVRHGRINASLACGVVWGRKALCATPLRSQQSAAAAAAAASAAAAAASPACHAASQAFLAALVGGQLLAVDVFDMAALHDTCTLLPPAADVTEVVQASGVVSMLRIAAQHNIAALQSYTGNMASVSRTGEAWSKEKEHQVPEMASSTVFTAIDAVANMIASARADHVNETYTAVCAAVMEAVGDVDGQLRNVLATCSCIVFPVSVGDGYVAFATLYDVSPM